MSPQNVVLHLVCHPSWMREELSTNTLFPVQHSYGFEVPQFTDSDIWWIPQQVAVDFDRALNTVEHEPIKLVAPGGDLVGKLPREFIGREVQVMTVSEALAHGQSGWWKSAEGKIDGFAASLRRRDALISDIEAIGLPNDSLLQFTRANLDISYEYRSFVSGSTVVTSSIYLDNTSGEGLSVYDGAKSDLDTILEVEKFVARALETIETPPSMVVDTAVLKDGSFVILEFNPSWCSAWYDCDIDGVVKVIAAGFGVDGEVLERWRYKPDCYLMEKSAKKRIHPISKA